MKWSPSNVFTITNIAFKNIPSFEFAPNDVTPSGTCTPSRTSGFATLSTSADTFASGDVGKYVTLLPTGRFRIDEVSGARSVKGYFEEDAFDTSAVASGNWTVESGWSPLWGSGNGYPAVCGFHEGRMILCIFANVSTAFAFSVVNSPFDFSVGDGSTAYGGWRILSYDQKDGICHLVSQHSLYFFCEYWGCVVDSSSGNDIKRAAIEHDTPMGTVRRARPAIGDDGNVYFFQRNTRGYRSFHFHSKKIHTSQW
jgi:hypothetical protein